MSGITLLVEDPKWRTHRGLAARLASAAEAARKAARLKGGFTILLADDKKVRAFSPFRAAATFLMIARPDVARRGRRAAAPLAWPMLMPAISRWLTA
jgi:hypothetical protein